MHLWYASTNTTFKQIGWRYGDSEWAEQQDWKNLNGHAGVGCYSWGEGTVTYVMFVDLLNTVNFYWKDTDTNTTSTESHPINVWTNCKSNFLCTDKKKLFPWMLTCKPPQHPSPSQT
jgi:hypothetical protein